MPEMVILGDEEGDPFDFLVADRDGVSIDDGLASALLRLNDPIGKDQQIRDARTFAPLRVYDGISSAAASDHAPAHDYFAFNTTAHVNYLAALCGPYDCNAADCGVGDPCTLPDCTLDPKALCEHGAGEDNHQWCESVCCGDDCVPVQALTVTCDSADCDKPNRCDRAHVTCNDESCGEETCAEPDCPDAFPHFDVCFESACAPSPGCESAACSPAPCALDNCHGTFVRNTCGEGAAHPGWDPDCASSTLGRIDVIHDYSAAMAPFGEDAFSRPFYSSGADLAHDTHMYSWFGGQADTQLPSTSASSLSGFEGVDFGLSSSHSTSTLSPSSSSRVSMMSLDPRQQSVSSGVTPVRRAPKKRTAECCRSQKRQRVDGSRTSHQAHAAELTLPISHSKAVAPVTPGGTSEHSCEWIVNPDAPSSQQRSCAYIASCAADLHAHLISTHSSTLNSTTRYFCQWAGCERFLHADYGQKSKLNRHLLTHSQHLPYPCSHPGCGKAFSTNDQRRNHEATHTDERKYVCEWPGCGARFRHATSLSTHRFTHTGEKPYVCWVCGHRESDPSNKSKHMKREHPDLPRVRPPAWDGSRARKELENRGYEYRQYT